MNQVLPLSPEIEEAASNVQALPYVHQNDFIYHFVIKNYSLDIGTPVEYYFNDGLNSARLLAEVLHNRLGKNIDPYSLLEFASGYGCVTRHLKKTFPLANITCCDIHPQAVEFLAKHWEVQTVLSNPVPEMLVLPDTYDVIFALSFFSHMPFSTWGKWLKVLYNKLKSSGFLIFTTHGLMSRPHMGNPVIPQNGFWFRADSEQEDLNGKEYGLTITTREFVTAEVHSQLDVPISLYEEAYWWGHQDLYVLKR